ncbi:helix-turn-helix transcriptional regulator [Bacillus wiedmannii]|uniref:helix-turn-helix transcriptional regulator n=1 Tax=Bacillus wiedmannii TaxID=1890302 RepID=UPI00399C67D0
MGTSKLKIERVKSNLTQEELAKIIGVTRQTIGLIEKGKYNPSCNYDCSSLKYNSTCKSNFCNGKRKYYRKRFS